MQIFILDVGAPKIKKQALEVVRNFRTPLSSTQTRQEKQETFEMDCTDICRTFHIVTCRIHILSAQHFLLNMPNAKGHRANLDKSQKLKYLF